MPASCTASVAEQANRTPWRNSCIPDPGTPQPPGTPDRHFNHAPGLDPIVQHSAAGSARRTLAGAGTDAGPRPFLTLALGPCPMLVTVYIPTKNRVASLRVAVESVLCQSHADLELIVVDDGSTDDTPQYLRGVAAHEPRLRTLRHAQSRGGPAARNAAILAARGEFVTGLDDDDSFAPERLEVFLQRWHELAAGARPPSCLYSQLREMQHGRPVAVTRKSDGADFEAMFHSNVVGNQVFAPRRTYLEAGLFLDELPAWQDLEFFMRLLKKFGPGRLVDRATYHFDNTPRADRVSLKGEHKLRTAFAMVDAAHSGGVARRTQSLYLQLFARVYGVRPSLADYRRFVALGLWPQGLARLLRASLGPMTTALQRRGSS